MIDLVPSFVLVVTFVNIVWLFTRDATRSVWLPAPSGIGLAGESLRLPSQSHGVLGSIGTLVRRGRPADRERDRSVGRALMVGLVAAVAHPAAGVAGTVLMWFVDSRRRNRQMQAAERRIRAGLAEVIDLFAVALGSGHTVAAAIEHVVRWSRGELASGFEWCLDQCNHGRSLADALEDVPDQVSPQVRPLVAALVAHDRYGAPIGTRLTQLAYDSRLGQRRDAEVAARRLPVAMIFPLVVCVLPAFLLLTVVPVVAESLSQFEIFASP